MKIDRFDIDGIAKPSSRYHHAVETTGHGRLLHVSGLFGVRPDGTFPDDAGAQIEQAWQNVLTVLQRRNMWPHALVKVNAYLTDRAYVPTYRAVRDRMLGDVATASTLLIVAGLADPKALVEIEAVAAAGDEPSTGA